MKIAYIFSTLAKTGGTERMIAEKANYLACHFNYEVTLINLFQKERDENHFMVSDKVKQYNLGIPYYYQFRYKYPKRLLIKWKIKKQIKKSIKQYVQKVDPDILIGISFFNANLISKVKCRAKKIIESHEVRSFTQSAYENNRGMISKLYQEFWRVLYFWTIERNTDAVITLTEGDKKLWKRAKRVEVIPNFSIIPINKISDCTTKRVIAVGRLTQEKGFDRLIKVWGMISSMHTDWHLDIFGQGNMHDSLIALAKTYNANNLTIHDPTSNISQEFIKSSICAVTSYYEGFSLVTLEAMKHGVPCVAFDCPFGPRSIIDDASCGFLVENNNINLFAEKLCRLIEDDELRKQFSTAAIDKAKSFDVDTIMNKLKAFYEQLVNES